MSEENGANHYVVLFEFSKSTGIIKQACLLDEFYMEQSFYALGIKIPNDFKKGTIGKGSIYNHKIHAEHSKGTYKIYQDAHNKVFKDIIKDCTIYKIETDDKSETVEGLRCGRSFENLKLEKPEPPIPEAYYKITEQQAIKDIEASLDACLKNIGDDLKGFLDRVKVQRSPDARSV